METIRPEYPGNILSICSGTSIHLWNKNDGDVRGVVGRGSPTDLRDTAGRHANTVGVDLGQRAVRVAWNRNNKVMALSLVDGTLQLRYANGAYMRSLVEGGGEAAASSLSWSLGSKTLAIGRADGVEVHDMTVKVRLRDACW